MKHLHNLAGFLSALCLMAILLITSVEAVAYWTPGYYEKEYTKYQVLENLPEMTMDDLLIVTDEMMDYLRGDREDLHVFTTMGGEYREFFNEREIAHMEDVKDLLKPPFDKPISFIKMFDMKTRTALMQTINKIKENAVNVVV